MILAAHFPRPLAFVLGGGGSLGAMQVGMVKALAERGIRPDLVVGTSIGAMNGSIIAADPILAPARLREIWAGLDPDAILGRSILRRIAALARRRNYLYRNDGVRAVVERYAGRGEISDLELPFGAVALDIASSTTALLRRGRLVDAVLASAAIPGVFPPVEVGGRLHYDGGLTANVPILQAIEMGAKSAVVLDCIFAGQRSQEPTDLLSALFYASLVATRAQAARELPLAAAEIPILYLPGPRPRFISPLNFDHSAALIADAYASSLEYLTMGEVQGPGIYPPLP